MHGLQALQRDSVRTLQVNVTKRCNLACHHCHVESGPSRSEALDRGGAERILELLAASPKTEVLDLTGGAPELSPHFQTLVAGARSLGRRVIDRCNLTVFDEPGQQETPELLAAYGVEVVASLPCTAAETVERQRGRGVFDRSISALRRLNALGYGMTGTGLRLDLVYNPPGPSLPPEQAELEEHYRCELRARFGIAFDRLITITNMPIKRFAHDLARSGRHGEYMSLLVAHFNPSAVPALMCRTMISVDHEGRLYDCDFNQALEIRAPVLPRNIWELGSLDELSGTRIATASHCFGCTAGAGSSCGGALVARSEAGA